MSLNVLNDVLLPLFRFDRVKIAEVARDPQFRFFAFVLLLSAGFARPFQVTVGDIYEIENDEDENVVRYAENFTRIVSVVMKPLLSIVYALINSWICRAFDKPMQFWWGFNLLGLASIWDVTGWLLIRLTDTTLPIEPLSWLLSLITVTIGLSQLSYMSIPGSLMSMLMSACGALCVAFTCIATVVVALLGVVVGAFTVLNATDMREQQM
mmetsp:Transcript_2192/g.3654  ORF Transcript_2192/g.3654 Transcript_2192/m.3654 type:complete len:210 (-) Transcript_2192:31-660(-)